MYTCLHVESAETLMRIVLEPIKMRNMYETVIEAFN
jgi:hypothetical protein